MFQYIFLYVDTLNGIALGCSNVTRLLIIDLCYCWGLC